MYIIYRDGEAARIVKNTEKEKELHAIRIINETSIFFYTRQNSIYQASSCSVYPTWIYNFNTHTRTLNGRLNRSIRLKNSSADTIYYYCTLLCRGKTFFRIYTRERFTTTTTTNY